MLNVGELYAEKEQWEEAFSAWATLYKIARNSNNTKYLQELEKLASELNMPPGKEVWKELAQKYYQ